MKQLVSKLEVVTAFDPVKTVFKLPIRVQKSGCESGSKVEVATHVHRNRTRGNILGHVDAEFGRG